MRILAIIIILMVVVFVIAAASTWINSKRRQWRSRNTPYTIEERREFNQLVVGVSQDGLNFIPSGEIRFKSLDFEDELHSARSNAERHAAALNQNKKPRGFLG